MMLTCYGNQSILGAIRKRRYQLPSLFALLFDIKSADRKAIFGKLYIDNSATSFGELRSSNLRDYDVKTMQILFVMKRQKLADPIFVWHTGIPKRIAVSQFRFQQIKWQ